MSRHPSPPPASDAPPLSPHEIRELSVRAKVHPATVHRFLRGAPVRSTVRARIAEALAERRIDTDAATPGTAQRRTD